MKVHVVGDINFLSGGVSRDATEAFNNLKLPYRAQPPSNPVESAIRSRGVLDHSFETVRLRVKNYRAEVPFTVGW
jgi:hypothetical protein